MFKIIRIFSHCVQILLILYLCWELMSESKAMTISILYLFILFKTEEMYQSQIKTINKFYLESRLALLEIFIKRGEIDERD